jgi:MraZ protein
MFMGEYSPALDEKGRVAIPVKLRKAFGEEASTEKLVVTHGFDKCLMAFREQEWREFVETKLMPLSQSDPKNRMSVRFLIGGASECELDKQGRMVIPAYLLKYAEIESNLIILGLSNKIEIWSKEVYENYKPDGSTLESFANDLGF